MDGAHDPFGHWTVPAGQFKIESQSLIVAAQERSGHLIGF
jgi:hypothetical protein